MKKFVATLVFLVLYFAGVLLAWSLPALKCSGWTVLFALVWFFVVSKVVSYLAARLGWTEPKSRQIR